MKNFEEVKKRLLKDPAFRTEYDRLEPEFMLAEALIRARLEKKMTQTELAKKAGISQVMVARLESGNSNPTLETISRVANVLGKEVKLVGTR